MNNFRSQYLAIYRLLLLLLAILVPVFSFTISYLDQRSKGVPLFREFVTILGVSVLIGTYKSKIIRKHIQLIMLSLYILVFIWQFSVLIIHDFQQNNVLAFLIIGTAVCVGFERKKLLLWFLTGSFISTTLVVLLFHDNLASGVVLIMTLASIYIMILLITLRKFKAENRVVLFAKELQEKNREVLDSITYAKRIQSAILPPPKFVTEKLKDAFIFYKPKDIVAGDFYWLEPFPESPDTDQTNSTGDKIDRVLFAAADCTGHGVPGAMVSVICNNGLNRSVREHRLTDPGAILDKTREIILQEFEKSEEEVKDGMDIALCSVEGHQVKYAGANNPMWMIRQGEMMEIGANKQPIGKFVQPTPYTTHTVDLQKGDIIYIFTDGFADQFGGRKGKKYKPSNFRKLLLSIHHESMEKQKELLSEAFESWKGELEQLDDVCIVGVRV